MYYAGNQINYRTIGLQFSPYHLKSTLHVSRRICKDHYILSMARILVQLNANNLNPQ